MSDTVVSEASEAPAPVVRWWQRREVKSVFRIWLALSIVGMCFAWVPSWLMGPSASTQMDDVKQTITMFTLAAMPVGAIIWSIMIYSLVRWRYTGDEPPPDDAPGFTTNSPAVLGWAIGSGLLTMMVFIWGLLKIASIPSAGGFDAMPFDAPPPIAVQVTGNQWVWNFTYPEYGDIQSDVLYMPVNHDTNFSVTSKDVIHSFWIVEMGVKVDANPGAVTQIDVTPHTIGTFQVRCAELCGILHAAMQTQAKVLSQADFDAWVKTKQSETRVEPQADSQEGGA
jgi:cytochrome c oxidase subunit 2